MKKIIVLLTVSMLIFNMITISANADWINDEGQIRYQTENGAYFKGGLLNIDGIMYKFNDNGFFRGEYTGWTKNKDGNKRYYLDGKLIKNEDRRIRNKFYFFDENGYCFGSNDIIMRIFDFDIDCTEDSPKINFYIENLTDSEIAFGHHFYLEKLIDGKWEKVIESNGFSWKEEAVCLSPENVYKETIDIKKQFGKLEKGIHKISKYECYASDVAIYKPAARSDSFEVSFDENGQYVISKL